MKQFTKTLIENSSCAREISILHSALTSKMNMFSCNCSSYMLWCLIRHNTQAFPNFHSWICPCIPFFHLNWSHLKLSWKKVKIFCLDFFWNSKISQKYHRLVNNRLVALAHFMPLPSFYAPEIPMVFREYRKRPLAWNSWIKLNTSKAFFIGFFRSIGTKKHSSRVALDLKFLKSFIG